MLVEGPGQCTYARERRRSLLDAVPLRKPQALSCATRAKRPQPLACSTGLVDAWPRATAAAKHQTALDRLRRLQLLVPTRTKECAPCCQGGGTAREVVRVPVCCAVQGALTR